MSTCLHTFILLLPLPLLLFFVGSDSDSEDDAPIAKRSRPAAAAAGGAKAKAPPSSSKKAQAAAKKPRAGAAAAAAAGSDDKDDVVMISSESDGEAAAAAKKGGSRAAAGQKQQKALAKKQTTVTDDEEDVSRPFHCTGRGRGGFGILGGGASYGWESPFLHSARLAAALLQVERARFGFSPAAGAPHPAHYCFLSIPNLVSQNPMLATAFMACSVCCCYQVIVKNSNAISGSEVTPDLPFFPSFGTRFEGCNCWLACCLLLCPGGLPGGRKRNWLQWNLTHPPGPPGTKLEAATDCLCFPAAAPR
jgi:hypothetical protein